MLRRTFLSLTAALAMLLALPAPAQQSDQFHHNGRSVQKQVAAEGMGEDLAEPVRHLS